MNIELHRESFYIGGQWRRPQSERRIEVVGANTGEVIGQVPEGTEADIDAAVLAARQAMQGEWAAFTPQDRAAVLLRFADALKKRAGQISTAVSIQNGMPISLSEVIEAELPVGMLQYYASLAAGIQVEERRRSPLGFDTLVRRDPIGVVGAIVPWNYPVILSMSKIATSLATGCAVVLKPSPGTVLDCYFVAEAAAEAGIPPGVLNWVPGGRQLGAYLVAHPGVDKVAFTGSTAAGRQIGEVCGRLVRPVSLELGGKSAGIILDDAKMDSVVEGLRFAGLGNNGQTCALSTRILAPASRYDEIVDALASMASSLKVGSSLERATDIGPLASEEHRARVEGYIAKGKDEARLVAGGKRPAQLKDGWFVEPTIFADVSNSDTIAREEIFGPVLSIIRYESDDDAIRIANESEYGLGGTIWSTDNQRAIEMARRVQTGTIGVNGYVIDLGAPFGGIKASGLGRELGPESLAGFQQLKSIYLPAG